MGLDTLAAAINEEPETLEDVYEPLDEAGLLKRTRGRVVTGQAYWLLGRSEGPAQTPSRALLGADRFPGTESGKLSMKTMREVCR